MSLSKQKPLFTTHENSAGNPQPTTTSRIIGYDVARSLAVFGMVLVNYRLVMVGSTLEPSGLATFVGLFEGRAAALFVILAGVGISLLASKARKSKSKTIVQQTQWALIKRALFLFVVGLLYVPIWPADILHFYGVYMLIALLMVTASDRQLWQGALGLCLAFPLLTMLFDYTQGWDFATLAYEDFWTPLGMIRHLFFNGFHPAIPWCAFMLFGMWLGRQEIRQSRVRWRLFLGGMLTAVCAELLSITLTTLFPNELGAFFFDTSPMPPMPLYIFASAGTAVMIIMLCLELTFRYPDTSFFKPLVTTGQLALTLYVAHVVVGMGILEAIGKLQNQTLPFAVGSTMLFCIIAVSFAHFWRKRFKRGPLEWVMRQLTSIHVTTTSKAMPNK